MCQPLYKRLMRWLLPLALALAPSGMVAVPPGDFTMGSDYGEADERPAHTVSLAAFFIDRDEVTVGAYRRCVTAKQCREPRGPVGSERAPVTWVSWRDAYDYCRFVGRRLPTEAEWERAARGGDGRRFPWGNDADCTRANFGNFENEGICPANPGRPVEVGSFSSGTAPSGARDMAGNVWEWVADVYGADYYTRSPRQNPKGPGAGPRRVLRGGACCSMLGLPRAANRLAFPPDYVDKDIGFRCAVSGGG